MNPFRPSPAPRRYAGIGLVVVVHLAAVYALSAGLIKPLPKPKEATVLLPPIPDEPLQRQPLPEPLRPDRPTLRDPQPIPVPDPGVDIVVAQDPIIGTAPLRSDAGASIATGPGRPEPAPMQHASQPQVQAPGAVCAVMPRPDVPAVGWSGEAVLQVIATVRGGRVVGSEFRVAQGALDGKTRRALQRSVESALAGYQCQGDAMFQQDFAFRLD